MTSLLNLKVSTMRNDDGDVNLKATLATNGSTNYSFIIKFND